METALLVAAFGIAALCAFLLLFGIINSLRGRRSTAGRIAVTTVGMSWAVWQVYVLNPVAGKNLTYVLAPIAFASVLLILSWAVKDAMSRPPSDTWPVRAAWRIPIAGTFTRKELPWESELGHR